MGVRADDEPWPAPDPDPEVLALRRRVLAEDPDAVLAVPGHEAAVDEACAGVALADLAVTQADDLCVLAAEPGWPLVAGALLFPSHWRLAEKLGRPLADVHDRVPGYPAAQVDRFLDRLRPDQVVWRRNLLFHRDGELHAPWPSAGDVPVERWWLRSERQTLRRLPVTGAVRFTIATTTVPLADLDVDLRTRLAARVAELPEAWAAYAGVGARRDELVAWLAAT